MRHARAKALLRAVALIVPIPGNSQSSSTEARLISVKDPNRLTSASAAFLPASADNNSVFVICSIMDAPLVRGFRRGRTNPAAQETPARRSENLDDRTIAGFEAEVQITDLKFVIRYGLPESVAADSPPLFLSLITLRSKPAHAVSETDFCILLANCASVRARANASTGCSR